MFGGAKLGDEGIVYRTVEAAPPNREPRLTGAPVSEPLRVRVLRREDVTMTRQGYASNAPAREHIAKDLAADLVRLLNSGAEIERRNEDGTRHSRVTVCPGHIAVLVRTHRNAALIRDELDAVGVPAVINGAGSVFGTLAARDWMRLLAAIERPADPRRAHTAALTPFLGWTAEQVAAADDDAWEDVHQRLHHWARVLREKGVAALTETIALVEGLPGRVLADTSGERRLTDLRHVGQLLHAAAKTEQMGTAALVTWLRARIASAEQEADEERSRRLESDDEAVQVLTIHRSKGLEFPIVYYPYLWEPGYIPRSGPVAYHDTAAGNARRVDVGLSGSTYDQHRKQFIFEQRGEDLRLAYVALTRAQHQAIVWWAGSFDSRHSSLGRLLFARAPDGTIATDGAATPIDNDAIRAFMRAAGGRRRLDLARALHARGAGVLGEPPDAAGRAVGGRAGPRARPAVAAHVVLGHHGRFARVARGQRAGGARRRGRAGGAADADRGSRRRAGRACRCCSAKARAAPRSARSCTRSSRRRTSRRPDLDAELARARGGDDGAPAGGAGGPCGRHRRAAGGDGDAARPARRTTCGCATCRARTGWTS